MGWMDSFKRFEDVGNRVRRRAEAYRERSLAPFREFHTYPFRRKYAPLKVRSFSNQPVNALQSPLNTPPTA